MAPDWMPATDRDRVSHPDRGPASVSGSWTPAAWWRGWPWWAAMGAAAVVSVAGAVLDQSVTHAFGALSIGAYALGCVGAVSVVSRRGLFSAMAQPPLILVLAVVLAVSVADGNNGTAATVLVIGARVVGTFPVMAAVTAVTVLLGLIRTWRLRTTR